jgi:putative restriction endonuclease
MIESYLQVFSKLRTDRGRNRYPAATNHRAPHKPFLLLSIMDLIAQGLITNNFIEPSFELVDTWNGYWNAIMPLNHQSSMAYPFFFLRGDSFWKLEDNPAYKGPPDKNVKSMNSLREKYLAAKLDNELFQFMCDPDSREKLRAVLVQTYFHPQTQPIVIQQGFVNAVSYKYAQTLVGKTAEQIGLFDKMPEEKKKPIRDAGFRKAIVGLYEHRCAMCGIRMLTPEGHTVVEAAHVVPWSESHDDHPTNGMCLCRLCHWSFDEGLMSVGKSYEVLVSGRVRMDKNIPAHILPLSDRKIFTPQETKFWPSQDNLQKHYKTTYAK